MSEPLIKVRELAKIYQIGTQEVKALRSVDLDIHKNEYVALMGPSGSGKSTLMNILGCLDTPTRGAYFLNGQDVSTLEDDQLAEVRNREIGFVFQTFNLIAPRGSLDTSSSFDSFTGSFSTEWVNAIQTTNQNRQIILNLRRTSTNTIVDSISFWIRSGGSFN